MVTAKSKWCTHEHSCGVSTARGWFTVLGVTTAARLVWCGLYRTVFGEKTSESESKDLIPGVLSEECARRELRLALFLSSLVGSVKGINCALRLIRNKEDGWNSIIAGGVGGLSIHFCEKKKRLDITLLVFVRALTNFMGIMLEKYDIQMFPHYEVVLSSFFCAMCQWATVFHPTLVHYSIYNFIFTFSMKIDKYMLSYLRNLIYTKERGDGARTKSLNEKKITRKMDSGEVL